MWKIIIVLLFIINPLKLIGEEHFKIDVDYAKFRCDQKNVYLEIYYALHKSELKFVRNEKRGEYSALAVIRLRIWKNDSLWVDQAWKMQDSVRDTSQIQKGESMVDMLRYVVEPGSYKVKFYVQDFYQRASIDSAVFNINVVPYPTTKLVLSDIELASSIKKSEKQADMFYKNTLIVIPHPSVLYGPELPILYYYIEIYNLKAIPEDVYIVRCSITTYDGKCVKSIERTKGKIVEEASVEVGGINIASLNTGIYYLHFEVLDSNGNFLQSQLKKFFIYNPETPTIPPDMEARIASSEFGRMDEKMLDNEFKYVCYIATAEEKQIYNSLKSVDSKKKFLFLFWERRNPNKGSGINEYREQYLERIRYCEKKFASFTRDGWRTDRGRVYIKYGPPSDIEHFPNTDITYPYEIWHYDQLQTGVIFVFADFQGFGEYVLLHSTLVGEIQNPDWKRRIRK